MTTPDFAAVIAAARTDALAALVGAVEALRGADELRLREANAVRDALRKAFDAGVPRTEIAEATGLSRTRIYEIRDGK
jgi:DNA invertase Pin-like site-specific DNA recombinase